MSDNTSSVEGYIDYRRREFCKDIKCRIQVKLDDAGEGSKSYEFIRKTCKDGCIHTTYEFHHWLIEKGYLVVRPGQ